MLFQNQSATNYYSFAEYYFVLFFLHTNKVKKSLNLYINYPAGLRNKKFENKNCNV